MYVWSLYVLMNVAGHILLNSQNGPCHLILATHIANCWCWHALTSLNLLRYHGSIPVRENLEDHFMLIHAARLVDKPCTRDLHIVQGVLIYQGILHIDIRQALHSRTRDDSCDWIQHQHCMCDWGLVYQVTFHRWMQSLMLLLDFFESSSSSMQNDCMKCKSKI